MKFNFLFEIFITFFTVLSIYCKQCGIPYNPSVQGRIVGGTKVPEHLYPWMTFIEIKSENSLGGVDVDICGGSIINSQWVLTAAHCFDHPKGTTLLEVTITLGEYSTVKKDGLELVTSASRVVRHSGFHSKSYANDIALVKLNTSIDFKSEKWSHLAPVCMPVTKGPGVGQTCKVTGWGNVIRGLEKDSQMSTVLREAKVPIKAPGRCSNAWGNDFDPKRQICGGYDDGHQDFCSGDSGGPLTCMGANNKHIQYGLVSYGSLNVCAPHNKPGVYTKIRSYIPWMLEYVKDVEY